MSAEVRVIALSLAVFAGVVVCLENPRVGLIRLDAADKALSELQSSIR